MSPHMLSSYFCYSLHLDYFCSANLFSLNFQLAHTSCTSTLLLTLHCGHSYDHLSSNICHHPLPLMQASLVTLHHEHTTFFPRPCLFPCAICIVHVHVHAAAHFCSTLGSWLALLYCSLAGWHVACLTDVLPLLLIFFGRCHMTQVSASGPWSTSQTLRPWTRWRRRARGRRTAGWRASTLPESSQVRSACSPMPCPPP